MHAAEAAIRALGRGDRERAVAAAAKAAARDQLGIYAALPAAIAAADWDTVAALVGPGPLQALVEELRSG